MNTLTQKPIEKTSLPPVVAPRGSRVKFILQVVLWQIIALVFVEAVLAWAGLGEEEIFKLDPKLGFQHMPNKRVTWRSEGYSQSYFDANGMREPGLTVAKPAGVYRIALLGDSMVEGLQVPIEQTFGKRLEHQLNMRTNRHVQVLNFANSGYSTAQEYLLLQDKVLKYQPDLVLLGYNSRDMFENWSPPDQTITNVRPFALHLPGQNLVIDHTPVKSWMRSPRARFLQQIEWLRQNSRIYGLMSAAETQLSYHDPVYRAIIGFLTKPGATLAQWRKDLQHIQIPQFPQFKNETPSFSIQFFDQDKATNPGVQSAITSAPKTIPGTKLVPVETYRAERQHAKPGAAAAASDKQPEPAASPTKAGSGNEKYLEIMTLTMGSLLDEMSATCKSHGAKLAVFCLPSRSALSPELHLERDFFNITYNDEISLIDRLCRDRNIPIDNTQQSAARLQTGRYGEYFYLVHMNEKGHQWLANDLYPFTLDLIGVPKDQR